MNDQLKAAELLLDEWKWRHQHCWKSLQRFGITALAVAALPYAKAEILYRSIGAGVLVFPIASWIVAIAAAWLYAAEYTRCRPVETRYYDLLGEFRPTKTYGQRPRTRVSIGRLTISFFVVVATAVAVANAWILMKVANVTTISWYCFWIGAGLAMLLSCLLGIGLQLWAGKNIKQSMFRDGADEIQEENRKNKS